MGDLGKLIVAKGFEKFPNKSPNLVTLLPFHNFHGCVNWEIGTSVSGGVREGEKEGEV